MITFTVPGDPFAQPRHRTAYHGPKGKPYDPRCLRQYDDDRAVSYKGVVMQYAQIAMADEEIIAGPVEITIWAYYVMPRKYQCKRKTKFVATPEMRKCSKPDWDNVGKIVSDALNGVAYLDDQVICDAHVHKRFAAQGEGGRLEVTVEKIKEPA